MQRHETVIMVVEDDRVQREAVVTWLIRRGFEVIEARDGETALAMLRLIAVDVLFTDLLLPGVNGAELARLARSLHPDITIVSTTGNPVLRGRMHTDDTTLLIKPYNFDELIEEIERVLVA
jgi:CheY-like chemotaxis protein